MHRSKEKMVNHSLKFGIYSKSSCSNIHFYLLLCISFLYSVSLVAQTDREFWFAAPEISYELIAPSPVITNGLDRPIMLKVSTFEMGTVVTVDQPANPAFVPIIQNITPGATTIINLTPFIDMVENKPANTILNYGIRIRSTMPVCIIYSVCHPMSSAVYTMMGRNGLGQEFIIPMQLAFDNYAHANPPARDCFDIVATQNNTTVTVVPSKPLVGHAALDTFSIFLNRGQSWEGRATSEDATLHPGGTFVFADKPIAVTVTEDLLYVPLSDSSFDIAGDQLIPRERSGKEYFPAIGNNQIPTGNRLYIYAFENNTTVDTSGIYATTINRGEVFQYYLNEANGTVRTVGFLQSDKPVLVYGVGGSANPFKAQLAACIVPPAECAGSNKVVVTNSDCYGLSGVDFLVISKTVNQGYFTISGTPSLTIGNTLYPVPGTGGIWGSGNLGTGGVGWPPGTSRIISNSHGKFHLTCSTGNLAAYMQVSYFTNFSSLNLGPDSYLCPGDSVVLDAGFGFNSYLWSTGETTQELSVKGLGTFWVTASDDECTLHDTINVSYWPLVPISLGNDKLLCQGDSVLLEAGSGFYSYLWSTGATVHSIFAKTTGQYWVRVQQNDCFVYDTVQVSMVQGIDLGPDREMCQGDSVLLDAGTGMTNYLWNTGATSQTIWAKSGGAYSVLASVQSCDFADTVIVGYLVQPNVQLGADTSICTGQSIVFDAGFCAGCTYQWSNLATGQMNIGALQTYTANAAGIYIAAVTGPNGCTGRDTVTLAVGEPLTISVSIAASGNSVCQGSMASFVASPVNPGASPGYQWKVNGINMGGNALAFSYIPVNGDQVSCVMTSSLASCIATNQATSNIIQMTVIPIAQVGIVIATTNSSVCLGETASFTATPVNAGSNPFYEWQVNGNNLGPNSPVFSYLPANGDVVSCRVSSSATCVTGSPAVSNAIAMTVSLGLPASVTISASPIPFCPGAAVTFTVNANNAGSAPVYQWKVNGVNAINANNAVYTYTPLDGDSVRCVMTSNLSCVSGNPAGSQSIILNPAPKPNVIFSACFDTITTINAQPFPLKGGIPSGGTFSGPGVNSTTAIFNPSAAGTGPKTISYSYQNFYTCTDQKTRTIRVLSIPNFTCGGIFTDPRDNKVYPTVQIGSQCWMQTNLEFGRTIDEVIPQTDNCIAERYPSSFVPRPSYFYQWDELMDYNSTPGFQGLCPPGWHVPTAAEWDDLLTFFNGAGQAGGPMKDTLLSTGFQSLQRGFLYQNNTWAFMSGLQAGSLYWTSTPAGNTRAVARGLNDYNPSVSRYHSLRGNGLGVKCLMD